MSSRGQRGKGLLTTLGRVSFARPFYQCEPCSQGRFPDDERLDIVQTTYSPGVRRTSVRVREGRRTVTDGPFAETREQLGGFFLIDAKDLDEAIDLAAQVPAGRWGTVEI